MGSWAWYARNTSYKPFTYGNMIKDDDVSLLSGPRSISEGSWLDLIEDENVADLVGAWSNLSDKLESDF